MKDDEQREHKRTFDHIKLGFAQMRAVRDKFCSDKDKGDSVGWRKAFIVYSWIWSWQVFTMVGFGKMRKKDVYTEIEQKLIEPKPHIVVGALIRAGLVIWGRGDYEGKKSYCLQCTYLNEKMRNNDTNTKQAEDEVIRLESSAKGSTEMGEYYECGRRFYRDNNGESHIIPLDAPQRPTLTALWDGKQWCEPAMQKQSMPSQTKTEFYEKPQMSVGVVWFTGGLYGYEDENGNICRDYDGNILYIPERDAFNRPSIKHVYDFEVYRWCLPDELTMYEPEF